MIGVVRTLEFCDGCIMVLHLIFFLPILVLEGLDKWDDLVILELECQGMHCWWLNVLICLFLDSVQAFN